MIRSLPKKNQLYLEGLIYPEHHCLVLPCLLHGRQILFEVILPCPLYVVLQVALPIDERHIKVELELVVIRELLLQLNDIVLLPLPLIGSKILHSLGALVHLLYRGGSEND